MSSPTNYSNNAPVDERELRRLRRERARNGNAQASSSSNSITETSSREPNVASVDVTAQLSMQSSESKTLPAAFRPELHHRVDNQPSLSSEEDDVPSSGPLRHPARDSNATQFSRTREPKINFPSANDPSWSSINEELSAGLPRIFTSNVFKKLNPADLSTKFNNWLYSFFVSRFGVQESVDRTGPARTRPKRKNRELEFLRRRKNECRKVRRALMKAGLENSPEAKDCAAHWHTLVRRHNKLRKRLAVRQQSYDKRKASARFRKDPFKFAKELFKGKQANGVPTFSGDEAKEYFCSTYRDTDRNSPYSALPDQPRPPFPSSLFRQDAPTLKELNRCVSKKRNKAAPGFNSLTYVPYKKCPAIMRYVYKIGVKIWNCEIIPDDWAEAFIILLAKSSHLDQCSEFRPIAITCTVGKIFFSVLSDRLQSFMVKNCYIDREIQKGFVSELSGCLEHGYALFEAMREAKEEQRQIVITWIDLANAYGSVRHNLIQFALDWYHVPKKIQKLIFDYYEKLRATVITNDWSTGFFLFDIGLFQGCVLSTILFDCVFQLLLDFLAPLTPRLGFKLNSARRKSDEPIRTLSKAYADDLALLTSNPRDNQLACDHTDKWLSWTGTMQAKPRKCVSTAMKQFDYRTKHHRYSPTSPLKYSPFDPKLKIAGKDIKFLYDPDEVDKFKGSHFKFLGRHIHYFAVEKDVMKKILNDFSNDMDKIDGQLLNGFIKLWLYQHVILSRLAWPFLAHDLTHSLSESLEKIATSHLKKWAGIYKSAETGVLYRAKENFGLGLTTVTEFFERMQLVRCQILRNSICEDIRSIFEARAARQSGESGFRWRATRLNSNMEAYALHRMRFPGQCDRKGLGHGRYKPALSFSCADKRKIIASVSMQIAEEKRVAHSSQLARQGAWTSWKEQSNPFDFSWRSLIWGLSEDLIKFVIHASINWIKTPDLLSLWGYVGSASCNLCGRTPCSIHHILVNCNFALNDKRYTWRHDSVLYTMELVLRPFVEQFNKSAPPKIPPISCSFVKASDKQRPQLQSAPYLASILHGFSDWRMLVDYDHNSIVFPPEIVATSSRPDIIIWSSSAKAVILMELTVPAEEGFANASDRKTRRYENLVQDIQEAGWHAHHFPFEVGARGFVAKSTFHCLSKLGLARSTKSELTKNLGLVAARCSFAIYLARNSRSWDHNLTLLQPQK